VTRQLHAAAVLTRLQAAAGSPAMVVHDGKVPDSPDPGSVPPYVVVRFAFRKLTATEAPATTSLTFDSETYQIESRGFLIVKNASGTSDNAVVVVPGSTYGQANPDVTVAVPITTGERWIGPLTPDLADPTTGLITITHSQTASVTCAYVRV
jgi:hypothetical protein